MTKLRILCFHGFQGTGDALSRQMRIFREKISPIADFVYIDSPHTSTGSRGWWNAQDTDTPGVRVYRGWQESKDHITDFMEKEGPFDGILGFSQGSALAGLLVGLRDKSMAHPLKFNFAILIGGFPVADVELAK
jgi:hypothetical protein